VFTVKCDDVLSYIKLKYGIKPRFHRTVILEVLNNELHGAIVFKSRQNHKYRITYDKKKIIELLERFP